MTHEYVIALNGVVLPAPSEGTGGAATAIGWAADAVLAVGPDATVRSISRGDSTFLDLAGCVVTALPADLDAAQALVREAAGPPTIIGRLLLEAGLIGPAAPEPGTAADLAFWGRVGDTNDGRGRLGLVATVVGGAFTEGHELHGPFVALPRGPVRPHP